MRLVSFYRSTLVLAAALGWSSEFDLAAAESEESLGLAAVVDVWSPAQIELFERGVRPLFEGVCAECHSGRNAAGDLRFGSRESVLKGGAGGAIVVVGNPEQSRLIEVVTRDGELKMPPDESLTPNQVDALRKWIAAGLPWPADAAANLEERHEPHWAYQPVSNPPLPHGIRDSDRPGNPIDAFVDARLAERQLVPARQADARTLIRRVSLDLTGLLPTPERVERFTRDDRPDAYERLIDELLASPHFGEQWGRYWLDVARYSDTKGYVYAREERRWVHAWTYRDWVIRALNRDIPYDQFLRMQIAADQFAPADHAGQAAMGFLTLGRRFLGVPHDIIDDRIDVVTRGLLGLTVACARCHDHKYDPISTREYYGLYGVFANCYEQLVPLVPSEVTPEWSERWHKVTSRLDDARQEVADRVRARVADYLAAQFHLDDYPPAGFDQILAKSDILPAFVRRWHHYLQEIGEQDPVFAPWHALARLDSTELAKQSAEVIADLFADDTRPVNRYVAAAFATPVTSHEELAARYGELFARVVDREVKPQPSQGGVGELVDDRHWRELRGVLYGADAPCEVPRESIANIEFYFDTDTVQELWKSRGEFDRWLIDQEETPAASVVLADRAKVHESRVFRRGNPAQSGEDAPRRFLAALDGQGSQLEGGSGRKALAEAIVDRSNPLTARVVVNRLWQHYFGTGLVVTPSDFGTRAARPSHPDLLDWLATRLMEEGWCLKWLHRQIVLSSAYRRDSLGPADDAEWRRCTQNDPENRLLWRMNPRRMTFEQLRDGMLAATGELSRSMYGRPQDLFSGRPPRRSVYGQVDRQFLPDTLRIFDFANPDLHISRRRETTVPQQALFFLNDPYVIERATVLAAETESLAPDVRVVAYFQRIWQRSPSEMEHAAAIALIEGAETDTEGMPDGGATDNATGWRQLAQVMFAGNEFIFVD